MTRKLVMVGVVLAAVGMLLYILSSDDVNAPAPQEPTMAELAKAWPTYQNKKYGYEMRHPEAAAPVVVSTKDGDPYTVQFFVGGAFADTQDRSGIASAERGLAVLVSAVPVRDDQSLLDYIAADKAIIQDVQPVKEEATTIGGEKAYYLEYPASAGKVFGVQPNIPVVYYVMHNGYRYRIFGVKAAPDTTQSPVVEHMLEMYQPAFAEMIASLTFIEPEAEQPK